MKEIHIESTKALTRLLGHLSPQQLLDALGVFSKGHRPFSAAEMVAWKELMEGPRRKFIDQILSIEFPKGLTLTQVAKVDILYRALPGSVLRWKALRLQYPSGKQTLLPSSPELIQARISGALSPLFKHHTYAMLHEGDMWVRIGIYDGLPMNKPLPSTHTAYLILLAGGQWALMANLPARARPATLQTITLALGCTSVREHPLAGKDAPSLRDLLIHQQAQGPWSALRPEASLEPSPLVHPSIPNPKRVKLSTPSLVTSAPSETTSLEEAREKAAVRLFGSGPLPVMESLVIETELPLAGANKGGGNIRMSVALHGEDVLGGLREMVRRGVADGEMPSFLAEAHSLGANHGLVVRKDGVFSAVTGKRVGDII